MSEPRRWTDEDIETIKRLRAQRKTWFEVGDALGCSRHTVTLYARRIGLTAELVPLPSLPQIDPRHIDILDKRRPPLPPGHDNTWLPIIAGTILEGMAYPL